MRIRTQFIVIISSFGIILLSVAFSAIITNQQAEKARSQEDTANSIVEGVYELGYTSNDYLIYGESQQFRRWQSELRVLSRQVADLDVDDPEQRVLVGSIRSNLERLRDVFDSAASAGGGTARDQRAALDPAVLRVSWSRMAIQNRALISDSSRLSRMLREQTERLRQTHSVLMYVMLGVFGVFLFSIYGQFFKRILGAISTLQAGTEVLGSGNLDHRIEAIRNDEIGDLSRSFNKMSANLKVVTASKAELENEIAERKSAEAALRESEQRLVLAQEAGHVGVFDWDLAANHVVWTTEFGQILGLPHGVSEGDYSEASKTIHPDDMQEAEKNLAGHFKERRPHIEQEYRVVRPDTGSRWIETRAQISYSPDGEPTRVVGTAVDITERKQVEQLKDEFIGMVSHELKTPLTVLTGSIYTALIEDLPAQDRQLLLQNAAHGVERLTEIVDNLLELSRFQQDRLDLETEPTDLGAVVRPIIERFQRITTDHEFSTDFSTKLPRVLADRIRVERILGNLVDNAIKYSPAGGKIRIFGKREDNQLVIGVSDEGIGISQENQSKLFKRFERLDVWSKHGIQGVGLGLNVCRLLVEAQRGRIWVISEPQKGSTFFFSLPVAEDIT